MGGRTFSSIMTISAIIVNVVITFVASYLMVWNYCAPIREIICTWQDNVWISVQCITMLENSAITANTVARWRISVVCLTFVSFLKHTIHDFMTISYTNDKCETVSSFWKRPKFSVITLTRSLNLHGCCNKHFNATRQMASRVLHFATCKRFLTIALGSETFVNTTSFTKYKPCHLWDDISVKFCPVLNAWSRYQINAAQILRKISIAWVSKAHERNKTTVQTDRQTYRRRHTANF